MIQNNSSESGDKKKFIADVMKEILCHLSDKLEETQQTELIRKEFNVFVQQSGSGDTSRQLSKFLAHILKDER